jgi:shikimate kinase
LSDFSTSFSLKEIKGDITYFRKTYERANLRVDISDLNPQQAAHRVKDAVKAFLPEAERLILKARPAP